jgi:nanoRNase/pAp phosphatase (c-di-AMP/oligoRNAs hydrolase)
VKPANTTRLKAAKLAELLKQAMHVLVVMQDNPDPDSIASAMALRELAKSLSSTQCSIAHGGRIGRGENRALVQYLRLNLRPCSEIEFARYDLVATVDTQPGTGNNSLPEHVIPDVVIDHHPFRHASRAAQFTDVRNRYGATSTILVEYLLRLRVTVDVPLATALLYGIRSYTQDLGREASKADVEAVGLLFPLANKRMLGEIQRGSVERVYFGMLMKGLQSARVYGRGIISPLGPIDNPDMPGEIADLLLRDEGTSWTMCSGLYRGKLLISVRTSDEGSRADEIIRCVVAGRGTGGGHCSYAGGQIPLLKGTEAEYKNLQRLIDGRFLAAIGMDRRGWSRLV